MKNFKLLPYLGLCILGFIFSSCSYFLDDHKNDYLKAKKSDPIEGPKQSEYRLITDYYPVTVPEEGSIADSYEIPLPRQVFSSGTTNEIRLHKLGEIRWLYVETLPSSIWPLMKDFWAGSQYGMAFEDPSKGIIESNKIIINENNTKLRMRIEHGIRQASSEIFISHLVNTDSGSWIRVSEENNLEETTLRLSMDHLSKASSSGGTSLVALNLNLGQKAILKQREDGSPYIEMDLSYPRAWAAVDRALKEAIISVEDLDRDKGVFYITFSQNEERGFLRRIFGGSDKLKQNFKIFVKEEGSKCTITVDSEEPNSENFERELLSQINQSLS